MAGNLTACPNKELIWWLNTSGMHGSAPKYNVHHLHPISHNSLATFSAAIHPQNHSPDLWPFSQCDKTHIFASNIVVEVHWSILFIEEARLSKFKSNIFISALFQAFSIHIIWAYYTLTQTLCKDDIIKFLINPPACFYFRRDTSVHNYHIHLCWALAI